MTTAFLALEEKQTGRASFGSLLELMTLLMVSHCPEACSLRLTINVQGWKANACLNGVFLSRSRSGSLREGTITAERIRSRHLEGLV
jgi:hypothetical protein